MLQVKWPGWPLGGSLRDLAVCGSVVATLEPALPPPPRANMVFGGVCFPAFRVDERRFILPCISAGNGFGSSVGGGGGGGPTVTAPRELGVASPVVGTASRPAWTPGASPGW